VRLRSSARRLRRLVSVAALAAALGACELPSFGAPDAKSEEGESIRTLYQGFFVTSIVIALIVYGLIAFALIRYRRRNDDVPDQRAYVIPLEVFYTITPVLIVAGLLGFSWATANHVNELSDDPAVRVEVVGFQWSWQFDYVDEGFTVTGSADTPPELVLPVDEATRLSLVSDDVNHAFWVPDFLSKRDLIPGVDNEIEVTPTEAGSYRGRCAEFCGLDHWAMYFDVRVVPRDEYQAWLDERAATAEGGGSETVQADPPAGGTAAGAEGSS
jgi:cytochrome c oxidase subunit 2